MDEHAKKSPVAEDDFDGGVVTENVPSTREVSFILDHSALTLGFGNIRRWFDKEYFQSLVADKDEKIHLNIYIPMSTLHDLMQQKRLTTIASSRAKDALAFIDEIVERGAESSWESALEDLEIGSEAGHVKNEEVKVEQANGNDNEAEPELSGSRKKGNKKRRNRRRSKKSRGEFSFSVVLEERGHDYPAWSTCTRYQWRRPLNREFPAYKNWLSGPRGTLQELEELDAEATTSKSVTFLIRSCVYIRDIGAQKSHGASSHHWILVTEDPASRIWADSFGMDSLNINEAELLLFHGRDLGSSEVKAPGADFFSSTDVYDTVSSPLHNVVDTTSYEYSDLSSKEASHGGSSRKKTPPKKSKQKQERKLDAPKKENGVIHEDFGMISYAPRTSSSGLIKSNLFTRKTSKRNK